LVDSAAIIDYLDEFAGPVRALTPRDGPLRRRVLSLLGVELGIMDKLLSVLYERQFRPKEKWHLPWIEACETQICDGFYWLNDTCEGDWLTGAKMTQADVSFGRLLGFCNTVKA
jgi:glutathione S-transferase